MVEGALDNGSPGPGRDPGPPQLVPEFPIDNVAQDRKVVCGTFRSMRRIGEKPGFAQCGMSIADSVLLDPSSDALESSGPVD